MGESDSGLSFGRVSCWWFLLISWLSRPPPQGFVSRVRGGDWGQGVGERGRTCVLNLSTVWRNNVHLCLCMETWHLPTEEEHFGSRVGVLWGSRDDPRASEVRAVAVHTHSVRATRRHKQGYFVQSSVWSDDDGDNASPCLSFSHGWKPLMIVPFLLLAKTPMMLKVLDICASSLPPPTSPFISQCLWTFFSNLAGCDSLCTLVDGCSTLIRYNNKKRRKLME